MFSKLWNNEDNLDEDQFNEMMKQWEMENQDEQFNEQFANEWGRQWEKEVEPAVV